MKKRLITFLLVICITCSSISVYAMSYTQIDSTLNSKYMILVNREHRLSSSWKPQNMVYFQSSGYQLEKTCADALAKMIAGCKNAGLKTLTLYSGYRTYQRQYDKYYGKINYYMSQGYSKAKATQLTDEYYAPPGGSEHHTGLAADICTSSIVSQYGQLHESFGTTAEGKWLRNNCYKYGFILRYDKGKESITGYNYEPWHFRYVGNTVAKEIFDQKITLEEYIAGLKSAKDKLKNPPKFTVSGGAVSLFGESGTTVRYTTDGSTPTSSSAKYSSALKGNDITYKAIACYNGHTSGVRTVTVTKYGNVFTDIAKKDWYYSTVSEAVHQKLFNGVDTYSFAPSSTMTRAMFVQVFANLSGVSLDSYKGKTEFKDVKASAWYAPAINWAVKNGVASGLGYGIFHPNSPVTREQACVMIYNYAKSKSNIAPKFADSNDISKWAVNAVGYCADRKIVSGYPDNTFKPKNTATRAEAAKIFLNFKSK